MAAKPSIHAHTIRLTSECPVASLIPLKAVIHDARGKLQAILIGLKERAAGLDEPTAEYINEMSETLRDETMHLFNLVKAEIDNDFLVEKFSRLRHRLAPMLYLAREPEGKAWVSREALEKAIADFDDLMDQGVHLAQQLPDPEQLVSADLSTLVQQVGNSFARLHPKVDFALEVDPDCCVRMNDREIQRCLENLLQNALESLPESGGKIELTLSRMNFTEETKPFKEIEGGAYAYLQVIDNGSGIPEEMMVLLSDSMVTTKPGGSGIGLKSVRHCIQNHGGHVFMGSDAGEGTEVSVLLPLVEMPGVEPGSENEVKNPLQS